MNFSVWRVYRGFAKVLYLQVMLACVPYGAFCLRVSALIPVSETNPSKKVQTTDQLPGCPQQPVQRTVPRHKLTKALESKFSDVSVRSYVQALRDMKHPLEFVDSPEEFKSMVDVGRDAVPYLIKRLGDNDDIAREASWRALVLITNKRFLSPEDIRDSNSERRTFGIKEYLNWWTVNSSKTRTQWLIDDLSSKESMVARGAIERLGEHPDPAAIPALREALHRDDLSPYAAPLLARLGDKTAIPYLIDGYLAHEVEAFRREGICLLQALTKQTFDFDPSGSIAARNSSIQKWKEWWQSTPRN